VTTNNKASGKAKRAQAWEDPIVAEVRAVRDKIAARFDYDIGRIFDHFVSLEKKQRTKTSKRPPRTPKAKASRTGRRGAEDKRHMGKQ